MDALQRLELRYRVERRPDVLGTHWWVVSARYWDGPTPVAEIVTDRCVTHAAAVREAHRYARDAIADHRAAAPSAFRYRLHRRAAR